MVTLAMSDSGVRRWWEAGSAKARFLNRKRISPLATMNDLCWLFTAKPISN